MAPSKDEEGEPMCPNSDIAKSNGKSVVQAEEMKCSTSTSQVSETRTIFKPPPAAATNFCLNTRNCNKNTIAIGMEDSTIQIYSAKTDKIITTLKGGHLKKITGLAFSNLRLQDGILVSSDASARICVWSTKGWKNEKLKRKLLEMPVGWIHSRESDTRVQFHRDQIHVLVVHMTQIAIYETPELKCVSQPDGICHFSDATVCIFNSSNLTIRCRICPEAYLSPDVSANVYPIVIAAHPSEPNQFALGLTDGSMHVLEPVESEGTWGVAAPQENGPSQDMVAQTGPFPPSSNQGALTRDIDCSLKL